MRHDNGAAEKMYKRALEANPTHIDTLQYYAIFLEEVRGDMAGSSRNPTRYNLNPNHKP